MPRTARLDIPDLLQHVIIRGVERCDIFRDNDDRRHFLRNLSKLLVKTDTECFAWSLMTNHVHILLRPRNTRLSSFMRRLLTGYALYFNLKYQRSGHLFQNRYKSIVCEEDAYLMELVRYIHLNPLRVGLAKNLEELDSYPWAGHAVIMGNCALEGQNIFELLAFFDTDKQESVKRYWMFVADGVSLGKRQELGSGRRMTPEALAEREDELYDQRILGSSTFVDALRSQQELTSKLPQAMHMAILDIVIRVCHHLKIDPQQLHLNSRSSAIATARSLICYMAVRQTGHSGAEVGRYINLRRAGVSIAADRGERIVKNDPALLELIN